MLTTNNEELYKLSRELHDHGHMYDPKLPEAETHTEFIDLITE